MPICVAAEKTCMRAFGSDFIRGDTGAGRGRQILNRFCNLGAYGLTLGFWGLAPPGGVLCGTRRSQIAPLPSRSIVSKLGKSKAGDIV